MFELNEFEKFVIRHYSAITVAYLVIVTVLAVIDNVFENMFTLPLLLMLIVYFGGLFVIMIPSKKNQANK